MSEISKRSLWLWTCVGISVLVCSYSMMSIPLHFPDSKVDPGLSRGMYEISASISFGVAVALLYRSYVQYDSRKLITLLMSLLLASLFVVLVLVAFGTLVVFLKPRW